MEDKKALLISLLAIIILSFITTRYFKNLSNPLSKVEFPEFEIPDFSPFASQESGELIEFISPDKKLKLKYPSHWTKMTLDALTKFDQVVVGQKAKNLLFVQAFKLEKRALAFLTVQELTLGEENSLEKIIEIIEEGMERQEGEVEITNLEIEDGEACFEGKYRGGQSPPMYSKEKIILGDNKAYLISLFNFENDWSEFEKEVSEILSSVELLN
jgi:hypothetical protein